LNREEKKERMTKVVEALLLEADLKDMLTDEEKHGLLMRAFRQQLDAGIEHLVHKTVQNLLTTELQNAKERISNSIGDYLDANKPLLQNAIKDMVKEDLRGHIAFGVMRSLKNQIDDLARKAQVSLNVTFSEEKK